MKISVKKIVLGILSLLPILVTALVYRELPDAIPIHWNINGTVTYGAKWNLFVVSSMNLFFAVLFPLLPKIDPRRKNYMKFQKYYDTFLIGLLVFGSAMWAVTLSESFAPGRISVGKVVTVGISLLLIFIGNMMPKIKNNYFMGIKTPWTLSNDDVWNKTHRLSGFLYVAAGTVTLVSGLLLPEKIVFWVMVTAVAIAVGVPTVMSYLWYRKAVSGRG